MSVTENCISTKWLDPYTREYYFHFQPERHQEVIVNIGLMALLDTDPTIKFVPIEDGDAQIGVQVKVQGAGGFVTGTKKAREAQVMSKIEYGLSASREEESILLPWS